MITPIISFSSDHFRTTDVSFDQLLKDVNALFEAVKIATEYPWDNDHLIMEDANGTPALRLSFDESGINVWSVRTRTSIGHISSKDWNKDHRAVADTLIDWANHAAEGEVMCNECQKWVIAWKHYSYAGSVCLQCYNPKKHLPPDTLGS